MARHYSQNQTPATSAVGVWNLIATLIAAGWTKPADSDGTTYSATGVQVTGGGSGTHGLGRAYAWVYLLDPAGKTSMTIQRDASSNKAWRICYSPAAKFITGSPAAHVCPSATDEYIILGSGTEASPTAATWFQGTEGAMRFNSQANDAAPYDWWMAAWPSGGGAPVGGGIFDGITGGPSSVDNDQHWICIDSSGATFSGGALGSSAYTAGNQPSLNTMAALSAVSFPFYAPSSGCVTDPVTGKDILRPLEFYFASPGYYKGQSVSVLWNMCGTATNQRSLGYLLSLSTTGDRIIVGTAALPWNNTVPLI